jgi:hypothetical protein
VVEHLLLGHPRRQVERPLEADALRHLLEQLVEGARADLLLVRANPLDDLATLASPLGVMADGRWYPEADLAARMDAVRKEYAMANVRPE